MRRLLISVVLWIAACVDVPANIHAQFAPAGATERSNYRPGPHGTASPGDIGTRLPAPSSDAGDAGDAGGVDAGAPDAAPSPEGATT